MHVHYGLCSRPILHSAGEGNVWKTVCSMDDQIPVNYDTIEQLFCLKQDDEKAGADSPAKQNTPTKVCLNRAYPQTYVLTEPALKCIN
jgi:hypothetical protein